MYIHVYMYLFCVVITGVVLRVVGRPMVGVVQGVGGGPGWGGHLSWEDTQGSNCPSRTVPGDRIREGEELKQ